MSEYLDVRRGVRQSVTSATACPPVGAGSEELMQLQPKLIDVRVPRTPTAAVLVLHGGGSRTERMVSPTQLSVLRMIPIARRTARAGRGRLAVFRLLNSRRGWDARHTPVDDVRWAIDQVLQRLAGATPIGLIGHSLGGRAALLAGGADPVRSVVVLAPFVYPEDGTIDLSGRRVLVVDGSADRIARPALSASVARALAARADVGHVRVVGGSHSMLGHHRLFDGLAADFTVAALLGGTDDPVVQRLLDGERSIEITP